MSKKRGRPANGVAPTFMVRLPEAHREKLRRLTGQTRRSMTAEVQLALEDHYRRNGIK